MSPDSGTTNQEAAMFHRSLLVLILFPAFALADAKFEHQVVAPYLEVRTSKGLGSGVVVDVKGEQLVLTAQHVVEGVSECVLVKRHDDDEMETRWAADVVSNGIVTGDGPDLALVRPRTPLGLISAKFCSSVKIERGEDAWYVGSHSGIHASLEKSVVNRPSYRIQDGRNDKKYTLLNGNAWYGNSGGPAYVKRGEDYFLVGIVVRLTVVNPRTPIACERLETIRDFLAAEFRLAPIPAPPKDPDSKEMGHPLVGKWILTWGGGEQIVEFCPCGLYKCERFFGRRWWVDPMNFDAIWFEEQNGTHVYLMVLVMDESGDSGQGTGWSTFVNDEGARCVNQLTHPVTVKRIELIPVMPREVKE